MNCLRTTSIINNIVKKSAFPALSFNSFSTSSISLYQNNDEDSFALSRKFTNAETYQPHDLDEANYIRHLKQQAFQPKKDFFETAGIDPLKHYKNVNFLSRYINQMGMIKPRSQTGLSMENQRRVTKAIKRARAFGLIPTTYKPGFGAISTRN